MIKRDDLCRGQNLANIRFLESFLKRVCALHLTMKAIKIDYLAGTKIYGPIKPKYFFDCTTKKQSEWKKDRKKQVN